MADSIANSLKNLRNSSQYEKAGSDRYFAAAVGGNAIGAMKQNHTALKNLIGTTDAAGVAIVYGYGGAIQNVAINPAGSLAWNALNTVAHSVFTVDHNPLDDNTGGAGGQQRAVNVIDGRGNTHSTLPPSGADVASVSNNHIIARIRQEIGAGANDARILELIGVMQNPNGGRACPTLPEAQAILKSIKTNLANALSNNIILPVAAELERKITALKRQDNSAAKRDVTELERIKKEVTSAKFGSNVDISKFKKSLDILESVHAKMGAYNAVAANIDDVVAAIARYDDLLRRGNSTEQDIDDAYNEAHAQCLQNPRFQCYLEELIESRDNYLQQRTNIENTTNAKTKFAAISTKTPEYITSATIFGALGITLTGVIGYWLREGFKTPAVKGTDAITHTIPGTTVSDPINHTTTTTVSYNVTDKAATPGTPEQGPTGAENAFIALVCIAILALTIYIAVRYIIRCVEDSKLNTDFSKLKINGIDPNKDYSQIQTDAEAIREVGMKIEKRFANRDRESVLKEAFSL